WWGRPSTASGTARGAPRPDRGPPRDTWAAGPGPRRPPGRNGGRGGGRSPPRRPARRRSASAACRAGSFSRQPWSQTGWTRTQGLGPPVPRVQSGGMGTHALDRDLAELAAAARAALVREIDASGSWTADPVWREAFEA